VHRLLKRQLKRHAPAAGEVPEEWRAFVDAVDEAYQQSDVDRAMLERSLDLTSAEMTALNSKLREQARELERSNSDLEQFAYVASHDLQEPLRTVQSYLQLITRRYGDKLDGDAEEFIGFAIQGATRMRSLIEDLLEFARVTSRARPFEDTDLGEIVQELRATLKAALDEHGAVLSAGALPTVSCDRRQVTQLLQNLTSNALKFHKPGQPPRVDISAEPEGGSVRVSVRDHGIGMEPAYLEKIFVIFQRLHSKDEYEGTGVGLAICKKIAERHGGEIEVTSAPGEGSTFSFTLPAPTGGEGEDG
jgi:light-regulated signal transduction histidine kinase (bacteriophytochrome)